MLVAINKVDHILHHASVSIANIITIKSDSKTVYVWISNFDIYEIQIEKKIENIELFSFPNKHLFFYDTSEFLINSIHKIQLTINKKRNL